jgi:multidrug transporter EmrE-like cation transporter
MTDLIPYLFIAGTIFFTVYGQLIMKWQVALAGSMPADGSDRIGYILRLLLNPWIISAYIAAFSASLCWMLAINKIPVSQAYPFTSLSFVFVLVLSAMFFQETITPQKVVALVLIITGLIVGTR